MRINERETEREYTNVLLEEFEGGRRASSHTPFPDGTRNPLKTVESTADLSGATTGSSHRL